MLERLSADLEWHVNNKDLKVSLLRADTPAKLDGANYSVSLLREGLERQGIKVRSSKPLFAAGVIASLVSLCIGALSLLGVMDPTRGVAFFAMLPCIALWILGETYLHSAQPLSDKTLAIFGVVFFAAAMALVIFAGEQTDKRQLFTAFGLILIGTWFGALSALILLRPEYIRRVDVLRAASRAYKGYELDKRLYPTHYLAFLVDHLHKALVKGAKLDTEVERVASLFERNNDISDDILGVNQRPFRDELRQIADTWDIPAAKQPKVDEETA